MQIKRFILGNYEANCYLISHKNEAIIVDPGYESEELLNFIKDQNLNLKYIFITHGHFDHVGGVNQLKKLYPNAIVLVHEKDTIWLEKNDYNLTGQKIHFDEAITTEKSIFLNELEFKIIFTPGHSAGGMSLLVDDYIFVGDTLFNFSIGRTDFPFGDYDTLEKSVRKLYELPNNTIVYPGHGEKTSIGFEKRHNYFFKG